MAEQPDLFPGMKRWLGSAGGAVPFRRFMEAALYDPAFGYYSRRIRTVGARGDFSTTATLSPRLAEGLAAWVLGEGARGAGLRHVIEIGPGSGVLQAAFRRALGWRGRWHWRSQLVERSPGLRAEQRRALGGGGGRGVAWHDSMEAALEACGGEALIFSNEVVDAFPVTLLQKHAGAWQEVWLELQADGRVVEALRPVGAAGVDTELKAEDFPEGQRIEVHESWRDWFRGWRPAWRRGTLLTIDYGDVGKAVYYRRPGGTVRGYEGHRRLEGPAIYRTPGRCDLTADVNFADLMRWGAQAGLGVELLETQAEFFARQNPPRRARAVDAWLAEEGGAGGAFRFLWQKAPRPGEGLAERA